jgi:hypothetical protein
VAFSDRSHGRKISAVHVLTDESTLNRGAWLGTHAYRYDVRAGRVQVTPATVSRSAMIEFPPRRGITR